MPELVAKHIVKEGGHRADFITPVLNWPQEGRFEGKYFLATGKKTNPAAVRAWRKAHKMLLESGKYQEIIDKFMLRFNSK